jgi:hypothetical protein
VPSEPNSTVLTVRPESGHLGVVEQPGRDNRFEQPVDGGQPPPRRVGELRPAEAQLLPGDSVLERAHRPPQPGRHELLGTDCDIDRTGSQRDAAKFGRDERVQIDDGFQGGRT